MESLGLDAAVFGATVQTHEWNRLSALPAEASAATALAAWWLDREGGAETRGTAEGSAIATRDTLRARLALSNADCDRFSALLDCREMLRAGPERYTLPARVRLAARGGFDDALEVLTGEDSAVAESWRMAAANECPSRRLPPPLVDGNDLVRAGLRPSPAFKVILDTTLDRQISGEFSDETAALAAALALASELGAMPT
jgi:hypothetical protein